MPDDWRPVFNRGSAGTEDDGFSPRADDRDPALALPSRALPGPRALRRALPAKRALRRPVLHRCEPPAPAPTPTPAPPRFGVAALGAEACPAPSPGSAPRGEVVGLNMLRAVCSDTQSASGSAA